MEQDKMIRICPLCYITVSLESEKKKQCSNCMASFYHYKPRLVSIDFIPPESNKILEVFVSNIVKQEESTDTSSTFCEDDIYALALLELESKNVCRGLWAKAFSESEGDENRSKALYIKFRVKQEKERINQKNNEIKMIEMTLAKKLAEKKDADFSSVLTQLDLKGYHITRNGIGWSVREPLGGRIKLDTDNSLLEYAKGKVEVPIELTPNSPSNAKDDRLQKSQQTGMTGMELIDNQLLFTVASKVASTINGILANGGKVEKSTKLYMYENSVSIGEFPIRDALLEVELSEIQGFNEFKESIDSGIFIEPAIDVFSVNVAKYIISKPSNKISRNNDSPKNEKHWIVIIVLSVLLFLFVAFRSSYHVNLREILGIVPFTMFVAENIGTSLIPFIVSYAVYFRKKSRNTSYIAFLCLWLAATAGALTDLTNKSQSSETLQKIYDNTKVSLPMMVDGATRLDSIVLNGNTLNYFYTLTNLDSIDVGASVFKEFSMSIKNKACTTPITREALDEGGVFGFHYYNKNSDFFGNVNVEKKDCH